jgi:hypothetical protein
MPAVIELRPVVPDTRQLHGLACALFEGDATDVGHLSQDKPFSIWPLRPAPGGDGQEGSRQDWVLRAAWLPEGPPPPGSICLSEVRIGHLACAVTETTAHTVTHAQLAAGPPAASARLSFRSPVYFSQNGTDILLPDPRLIVGSWRRNWDASLPDGHELRTGEDVWRDLRRAVRLARFELRTATMDSGRGYARAGFTGTARLQLAKTASRDLAARFAALARFAEFCGTGAQTTHGFGATTLSPASESC